MRLKTLEMMGFKSFADRTVITFEDGITGVVGPNGCGKSNLVDAIRWVMGEMSAKHLRGSAMEDVIFNGCESRPPMGMSQIFLTFDNSDGRAPAEYSQYSEIQVGRRLYRSGESEYFINKTQCRLKDVIDLFLGTGVGTKAYSIVEQGMVGTIVSAKPEDRRMLIEEAAGISKFKARKEAALRKMESTRLNLARLTDILNELTRQINSLNRQAKKAERYTRISSELRERELALAATRFASLRKEIDELSINCEKLRENEAASSAELSGFEAEMESARLSLTEFERELDGVQQDIYRVQHAIKFYESESQHRRKELASLSERNLADSIELAEIADRVSQLDKNIDEFNSQLAAADLRLAGSSDLVTGLDNEVMDLRKNHEDLRAECDNVQQEVIASGEAIANLNAKIENLDRRRVETCGRIANDQAGIDSIDRRRTELLSELDRRKNELDGARQLKLQLTQEQDAIVLNLSHERACLVDSEMNLQSVRDELADKRSRLNSIIELRKNLEGYRDGVRAVLSRQDTTGEKLAGFLGTVSELLETDAEYETALGAVLGERLQYVVVHSHKEGAEAIDYLRQAASGRSSFIPLKVRNAKTSGAMPSGDGVVGPMRNFVRMNDDYRNICDYLLGDVVLVDDLNRALNLWEKGKYQKTFVTRDGCVVDPSGIISGGMGTGIEEQFIAQKRRAKELEEEVSHLTGELTRAEGETQKLRDRVKSIEEHSEGLRRSSHGEEIKFVGHEHDLARAHEELTRCESERDRLTVELAALTEELRQVELEKVDSELALEQHLTNRASAEAKLKDAQSALAGLGNELGGREQKLTDLKVELAQAEERQASVNRELADIIRQRTIALIAIGRIQSEIEAGKQRSAVLANEIEGMRADIDIAMRASTKLAQTQRIIKQRYEDGQSALRERELQIREVRKRHDESISRVHELDIKLTEHRGNEKHLLDGIRERYHIDLAGSFEEYVKPDLNLEIEEQAVAELKDKIEKIGPVNVDAIKEFDDLNMRQEFLSRQHTDLTASLENLSKAIQKINRTSRQRFRRAFDSVNEQFQMLFPKLFRGGRASLVLTDEENLLETGIEIIAQPPGKKLQSITLLSGGERALTAVALIFSIFLIKPSPFCLLDEVDAPLDDANIDRFNELIRCMTPHSQFILITHNKRTMELADLLYGVTMEEPGVSKIVSVRLASDNAAPNTAEEQESAVA